MALGTSRQTISLNGSEEDGARTYTPTAGSTFTFIDGTGALRAQKVGKGTITLTGGTAQTVALTSSSVFKDADGGAITFTKIKAIAFEAASGNSAAMVIGNNASNDWDTLLNATGTLTLPAGSIAAFISPDANGWAVTAGDLIKVDGDGTDSLSIWAMGEGTGA